MSLFISALFWSCFLLVIYTYIGYGILLRLLLGIKRWGTKNNYLERIDPNNLPNVTLLVAAYNEADCIAQKIHNSLSLDYPTERIKLLFVTDGSDDETPNIVSQYPQIQLLHTPARSGKIAAVHRSMAYVTTPYVVFTDANTLLNPDAIQQIVRHYNNPKVGAVAGEKRVQSEVADSASGAGEGFYWRYESTLKKWDSELYSVVGAAGELFSIRTNLYEAVPPDTIIEDFYMTLRIAQQGYRVIYEPLACATELPSASSGEELKRKIRIAAGGWQAISRLLPLLNVFKYGVLSFQYISHRVLRWTITPLALLLTFLLNISLAYFVGSLYTWLFIAQIIFYFLAFMGYLLEKKKVKIKVFFIPFYFVMMNYAVFAGFARFWRGNQSVVWEKAKRREN
jgi:biofilm PGA synthesis N-glycosyltransferase PgaC